MNPPNRKYILTPERRAFLQQHYRRIDANEITKHALFRGIPKWRVWHWAGDLGLTCSGNKWTPEQETYLEMHYHHKTLAELAERLQHTQGEILARCKLLGIKKVSHGYTLADVAWGLGVSEKTLTKWIELGWLQADKRVMERSDNRHIWHISSRAIRLLVRYHYNEINQHKVDWLWLMDVIFDGVGTPERK